MYPNALTVDVKKLLDESDDGNQSEFMEMLRDQYLSEVCYIQVSATKILQVNCHYGDKHKLINSKFYLLPGCQLQFHSIL